jgi:hypothetical protein
VESCRACAEGWRQPLKIRNLGAQTALCVAGATALAATAFANPVFVGDFESGNLSQYQSIDVQAGSTDRLVVVESPVRQGRYAVKATVKPGDEVKLGSRAELVMTNPLFVEGDERWFHWFTQFPADFQTSPKWHLFTQWHSGDFGVPLGFNLHGEQLSFRVMGTEYDKRQDWGGGYLWTAPLERGKWMEFLLRVKFSSNSNVGFVELWKDGKKVVSQTMHQTLYPGGSVYLKKGLYRDRSIGWNQSVFHDGMTVYSSRPEHLFTPPPAQEPPAQQPPAQEPPAQEPPAQEPPTPGPGPTFPTDPPLAGLPPGTGTTPPIGGEPVRPRLPGAKGRLGGEPAGCGASSMAGMLFPFATLLAIPVIGRRRRRG